MVKTCSNKQLDRIYYAANSTSTDDTCKHRLLENETGTGMMSCYDIADGIQLSYNNLNMDSCFQPMVLEKDFLQIDHCVEGCYEFVMADGSVSFLGEGDLCVTNLCHGQQVFSSSRIPLKKYRGITLLFEMEAAQRTLDTAFYKAKINLTEIKNSLCAENRSLLIKSKHQIDYIFSELYQVDERIKEPYYWLKTIELLLYLSLLDNSSVHCPLRFSKEVSQRTKSVYQYIIENPFSKATIHQLSNKFDVSPSSLKRCFMSISGMPIGLFMKIKCMEGAALLLLKEPTTSIGDIAERAGYENQGKFTSAFKSVFEVTPSTYRRKRL